MAAIDGQLFPGMRESSEEGKEVSAKVIEGVVEASHQEKLMQSQPFSAEKMKWLGEAALTFRLGKHVTYV